MSNSHSKHEPKIRNLRTPINLNEQKQDPNEQKNAALLLKHRIHNARKADNEKQLIDLLIEATALYAQCGVDFLFAKDTTQAIAYFQDQIKTITELHQLQNYAEVFIEINFFNELILLTRDIDNQEALRKNSQKIKERFDREHIRYLIHQVLALEKIAIDSIASWESIEKHHQIMVEHLEKAFYLNNGQESDTYLILKIIKGLRCKQIFYGKHLEVECYKKNFLKNMYITADLSMKYLNMLLKKGTEYLLPYNEKCSLILRNMQEQKGVDEASLNQLHDTLKLAVTKINIPYNQQAINSRLSEDKLSSIKHVGNSTDFIAGFFYEDSIISKSTAHKAKIIEMHELALQLQHYSDDTPKEKLAKSHYTLGLSYLFQKNLEKALLNFKSAHIHANEAKQPKFAKSIAAQCNTVEKLILQKKYQDQHHALISHFEKAIDQASTNDPSSTETLKFGISQLQTIDKTLIKNEIHAVYTLFTDKIEAMIQSKQLDAAMRVTELLSAYLKYFDNIEHDLTATNHALMGKIYFEKSDYQKSLKKFTESIECKPNNVMETYYARAKVYYQLALYEHAKRDCIKARELSHKKNQDFIKAVNTMIINIESIEDEIRKKKAAQDNKENQENLKQNEINLKKQKKEEAIKLKQQNREIHKQIKNEKRTEHLEKKLALVEKQKQQKERAEHNKAEKEKRESELTSKIQNILPEDLLSLFLNLNSKIYQNHKSEISIYGSRLYVAAMIMVAIDMESDLVDKLQIIPCDDLDYYFPSLKTEYIYNKDKTSFQEKLMGSTAQVQEIHKELKGDTTSRDTSRTALQSEFKSKNQQLIRLEGTASHEIDKQPKIPLIPMTVIRGNFFKYPQDNHINIPIKDENNTYYLAINDQSRCIATAIKTKSYTMNLLDPDSKDNRDTNIFYRAIKFNHKMKNILSPDENALKIIGEEKSNYALYYFARKAYGGFKRNSYLLPIASCAEMQQLITKKLFSSASAKPIVRAFCDIALMNIVYQTNAQISEITKKNDTFDGSLIETFLSTETSLSEKSERICTILQTYFSNKEMYAHDFPYAINTLLMNHHLFEKPITKKIELMYECMTPVAYTIQAIVNYCNTHIESTPHAMLTKLCITYIIQEYNLDALEVIQFDVLNKVAQRMANDMISYLKFFPKAYQTQISIMLMKSSSTLNALLTAGPHRNFITLTHGHTESAEISSAIAENHYKTPKKVYPLIYRFCELLIWNRFNHSMIFNDDNISNAVYNLADTLFSRARFSKKIIPLCLDKNPKCLLEFKPGRQPLSPSSLQTLSILRKPQKKPKGLKNDSHSIESEAKEFKK